mgnify:CR=1 FL=1
MDNLIKLTEIYELKKGDNIIMPSVNFIASYNTSMQTIKNISSIVVKHLR